MLNKSAFKVFLSIGLLNEDKWAFDFVYCFKPFLETNKSELALDTNLSITDFCYRYYDEETREDYTYIKDWDDFDENGLIRGDCRLNIIYGSCPVLYKYDKTRVQACKEMLRENLQHFSPAYADRKNLNKFGTTAISKCLEEDVITEGYFTVFPKSLDVFTGEKRGKREVLYYYNDSSDS